METAKYTPSVWESGFGITDERKIEFLNAFFLLLNKELEVGGSIDLPLGRNGSPILAEKIAENKMTLTAMIVPET